MISSFKSITVAAGEVTIDENGFAGDGSQLTGLTKSQVGLGNVDNTSDVNKPVSTAQATADTAIYDAAIQRANHTGTQSADTIIDGTTNKAFTATEKTKLAAISGTNTGDQTITLTGDVTGSGTGSFSTTISGLSAAKISAGNVSNTEFDFLNGVTSSIQDQLDDKETSGAAAAAQAYAIQRANHTGTQSADTLTDGTVKKAFLSTERTKLAGITAGASVSSVSGTGTVSGLTLTGTVTTSGSLTLGGTLSVNASNFASQTQNTFLAAPNGSDGVPTFRIIVAADVPTLNQNTTGSAATLTTSRSIYGNLFNGSADLTQIIASTFGGTGNGFTKFSGATTSEKTYTLPNASATILTDNAAVTVAQGGTGRATSTTAYGLLAAGTTATGAHQTLAAGATTEILVGGGASALPVWTTATGSGAPVRATSPTLVTPILGVATCTSLAVGLTTASRPLHVKDASGNFARFDKGDYAVDGYGVDLLFQSAGAGVAGLRVQGGLNDTTFIVGNTFDGAAGIGGSVFGGANWNADRGAQIVAAGNTATLGALVASLQFVNATGNTGKYGACSIEVLAEDTSRDSSALVFKTNATSATTYPSERLRITGAGLIGIANSSPSEKLDITGNLKLSGVIKNADGAVGAPSYSFSSDTDTGFYRTASGVTSYSSNGTKIASFGISGVLAEFYRNGYTMRFDPSGGVSGASILGTDTGTIEVGDLVGGVFASFTSSGISVNGEGTFTKTQNSDTFVSSINANTGTAGSAGFYGEASTTNSFILAAYSTGHSTAAYAGKTVLESVNGLILKALGGTVSLMVGSNLCLSGDSSSNLTMGGTLTGPNAGSAGGTLTMTGNAFASGNINVSGGASAAGGSITTNNGGGSINTTGVGSIGMGVAATRTTLVGSATAARTVTLPDFTGTLLADRVGAVVQSVQATYTTSADLTTQLPVDNTIPQSGEGTQIISKSITPTSASNKVRLRFVGNVAISTAGYVGVAVFNGGSNAIVSSAVYSGGGTQPTAVAIEYIDSPASASAVTYTVRVGPDAAVTVRLNGAAGTRLLGGNQAASLVLEEIVA